MDIHANKPSTGIILNFIAYAPSIPSPNADTSSTTVSVVSIVREFRINRGTE
ncbi:hypothetical protein [Rickettsia tamurae]|uniref:hypothetical protein n=1 Tax=Rickettsia tamurae TaxID=334545 RepID=UPI001376BEDE